MAATIKKRGDGRAEAMQSHLPKDLVFREEPVMFLSTGWEMVLPGLEKGALPDSCATFLGRPESDIQRRSHSVILVKSTVYAWLPIPASSLNDMTFDGGMALFDEFSPEYKCIEDVTSVKKQTWQGRNKKRRPESCQGESKCNLEAFVRYFIQNIVASAEWFFLTGQFMLFNAQ